MGNKGILNNYATKFEKGDERRERYIKKRPSPRVSTKRYKKKGGKTRKKKEYQKKGEGFIQ